MKDDELKLYHEQIVERYKENNNCVDISLIPSILETLWFSNISEKQVFQPEFWNMTTTFITDELVVKIQPNSQEQCFLANVIASEKLFKELPVVEVLAYDFFEKTEFEVLIMKRSKWTLLADDIFELSKNDLENLFIQILQVVKSCSNITFSDFWWISNKKPSYTTFSDQLKTEFSIDCAKIREQNLCSENDLEKIETYFYKKLNVFDNSESVFCHVDIHMSNILHYKENLTALLDFDFSQKAPKIQMIPTILGFISKPEQFFEWSDKFEKYKWKSFLFLLPILIKEFSDIFSDLNVLQKLNILLIKELIMWISQDWSEYYNREQIQNILENELPKNEFELKTKTYAWKLLSKYL